MPRGAPFSKGSFFLGRYRIEKRIGRGGMGEVWAATDTVLEREVAIKLIQPRFAGNPTYVDRFLREMRAVARLCHPNIAQLYNADRAADGSFYMVMQRVEGIVLRRAIDFGKRLDSIASIFFAIQVAEVLRLAHDRGIAHRDIKPENLIVAEDGHLWVLDFGVAQLLRSTTGGRRETERGGSLLMGTPRYMAPELFESGKADHRADLYALGIVLYEMVAGAYPYGDIDDDDEEALEAAHRFQPPTTLHKRVPQAPEGLWPILCKLLAKDPSQRYQDAAELIQSLRSLIRDSVPPEHPVAVRMAQDRLEQARRRHFEKRTTTVTADDMAEPQRVTRDLPNAYVPRPALPFTYLPTPPRERWAKRATAAAVGWVALLGGMAGLGIWQGLRAIATANPMNTAPAASTSIAQQAPAPTLTVSAAPSASALPLASAAATATLPLVKATSTAKSRPTPKPSATAERPPSNNPWGYD